MMLVSLPNDKWELTLYSITVLLITHKYNEAAQADLFSKFSQKRTPCAALSARACIVSNLWHKQ